MSPLDELRWLWPAAHVAGSLWDDESYDVLSTRHPSLAGAGQPPQVWRMRP
jgi:hypothetical protein